MLSDEAERSVRCILIEGSILTCLPAEILRKQAESTMHAVVRRIFRRLQFLDPVEEEKKLLNSESNSPEELKMAVQLQPDSTPASETAAHMPLNLDSNQEVAPDVQDELQDPVSSLTTATNKSECTSFVLRIDGRNLKCDCNESRWATLNN